MPSEAAGPVADSVTPIFTSASAALDASAIIPVATQAAFIQRNPNRISTTPLIYFLS
jgi:hypothetical protein